MLSKKNPQIEPDELKKEHSDIENDFSDVHSALDINPEFFLGEKRSRPGRLKDNFQREFQSVFNDESDAEIIESEKSETTEKSKFVVADSDGFGPGIFDWVRCIIVAVSIVVFILTFVFRLVEVDGTSMLNTLENSDKVIVTNMFYTPKNNDIIVISHAAEYNNPIIKRVIATAGQTVRLDYEHDKIYVDGVQLDEPYIKEGGPVIQGNASEEGNYLAQDDEGNFVVPEGKLFVLGDNRQVSLDSRNSKIGLIDINDVIGKAQFVVFPFNHFGNVYDK